MCRRSRPTSGFVSGWSVGLSSQTTDTPPGTLAQVGGTRAVVLDGRPARDAILEGVRRRLEFAGMPAITLATVLVGDDGPSRAYVASKHKQANAVGMLSVGLELPASASQEEVNGVVRDLASNPAVHGVLVQMPLPNGLSEDEVLGLIPAEKDVDGLTAESLGRLVRGTNGHVGCTPLGVLRLLQHYDISTAGKHVVVVGRSTLVGYPLSILLARKGIDSTVTLAHSRTLQLSSICSTADIVVSATGQARSIGKSHVREGAVVIDVGISRTEHGIIGDVDFDEVASIASAVTPMPGGTGLMTVACLLENTVNAARMQGVDV